ncbi:macrolide transporter [Haloprofundus marisrubri]|uniref:Macrolide transporter n=1 Tax=Haloprofundus marisrubri TaxID=1514971 RepID=A0A0W1R4V0_9EURY|nr:MFS transporter [Haloprofundus marisrubri]KTG08189.1 macrolide transporter [Haloprofundus marisrubri]
MRRLLRNVPFRRLFLGRLVTNAGDSVYYIAAMWLVYDLTGDPAMSGLAGFLSAAPSGLQFLTGPLVDRWKLRHVLVGTQLVQFILICSIPVADALGALSAPLVLVVMPLLALTNQFVYPAQTAALPRIVDRDELVSANSLFSLAYQGVDAGFNALAGVLIAVVGAVTLFLVDAVTFLVAALLFAGVVVPPSAQTDDSSAAETGESGEPGEPDGPVVADGGDDESGEKTDGGGDSDGDSGADADLSYLTSLREGIDYLRGTVVTYIVVGAVVVNFAFGAALASLPAYADGLGGAGVYGAFMAAVAGGMFAGALGASKVKSRRFGRFNIVGFSVSGTLWLASVAAATTANAVALVIALFAVAMVPVGAGNVLISALVQSIVPDRLLGRVSSVIGSAASAAVPFGSLVGGVVAGATSPAVLLVAAGVSLLCLGGYWAAVPTLRRMPSISETETLRI